MKYNIITSGDQDKLSENVNKAISEGWIPLGSVSVSITSDRYGETDYIFAQALIKNEP